MWTYIGCAVRFVCRYLKNQKGLKIAIYSVCPRPDAGFHHVLLHAPCVHKSALSTLRDGPDLPSRSTVSRRVRGGLARRPQLAVYDTDGPADGPDAGGKTPSLTPGESAPRSSSTRLSSFSRALSLWSGSRVGWGVGLGLGVGGSHLAPPHRTLSLPAPHPKALRCKPAPPPRLPAALPLAMRVAAMLATAMLTPAPAAESRASGASPRRCARGSPAARAARPA